MYSLLVFSILAALLPQQVVGHANTTIFNSTFSIIRFELDFTWDDFAPDGASRKAILTNGQLPGPALFVDQGQQVEVLARNYLPFPITLHFHGIQQLGTPFSDGVPGLSQRPIAPGCSFLYRWVADEYGSYWYHSHERGHISDGLYGAIIVKPSASVPSPFKLISNDSAEVAAMRHAEENPIPLIVSDWSNFTSEEFLSIEEQTGVDDFCVDAVLVNGKGTVTCLTSDQITALTNPLLVPLLNGTSLTAKGCLPANATFAEGPFPHNLTALPPTAFDVCIPSQGPTEIIQVDPANVWASINIIVAASINSFFISIDQHAAWVYAVDGTHIEPVQADVFPLIPGERLSLMVRLDQPVGDYAIRLANSGINQILFGVATMSYVGSAHNNTSIPSINQAGVNTTASVPAATVDETFFFKITQGPKSFLWTLSGKESYGLQLDLETPLLFDPNSAEAKNPNLTITTKYEDWIDLVISVTPPSPPHPLHKHANKGYVIGSGEGLFNYSSVAEAMKAMPQNFNLINPPLRDGFPTPAALTGPTWLVFRYQSLIPGAWLFHCHIQTHLDGGMAVAILDGIDRFPTVPVEYQISNGF